jgi:hypothetical protein
MVYSSSAERIRELSADFAQPYPSSMIVSRTTSSIVVMPS